MNKPKILLYDLETTPSLGYVWGKYDQTVLKFAKQRELLSVAYKWVGNHKIHCETREREKSDIRLAAFIRSLFNQADIVVAHNGNRFDQKVARTRMLYHKLSPPKQIVSVDTLLVAKNYFNFNGNSLADLAEFLNIGKKLPTNGIDFWIRCINNEPEGWREMVRYNKHDVLLLSGIYEQLKPWILSHPNVAKIMNPLTSKLGECPSCGSKHTQRRGYQAKGVTSISQRWQCQECYFWFNTRVVK